MSSRTIEDYSKALSLDPKLSYAWFNRGNLKCRLKDYNGAVQDYSLAIENEPSLAEAWFNRGLTLIYLNDRANACNDLSKAGELGIQEAYRVIQQFCKK